MKFLITLSLYSVIKKYIYKFWGRIPYSKTRGRVNSYTLIPKADQFHSLRRSPDPNPLDIYLWDNLKQLVEVIWDKQYKQTII